MPCTGFGILQSMPSSPRPGLAGNKLEMSLHSVYSLLTFCCLAGAMGGDSIHSSSSIDVVCDMSFLFVFLFGFLRFILVGVCFCCGVQSAGS